MTAQPDYLLLPTDAYDAELARRARMGDVPAAAFVREAWDVIEPAPLQWNWHLDVLCSVYERFVRGSLVNADGRFVRNLAINVPPVSTKTKLLQVLLPAWELTWNPALRLLTAGNAEDLAQAASYETLTLIRSDWYQERWGHVVQLDRGQEAKGHWKTAAGGHRIAKGLDSNKTGRHGDRVQLDDLMDAADAESLPAQLKAMRGLAAFSTRLTDLSKGRRLVIGQRLDPNDIFGFKPGTNQHPAGGLQHRPDWDHLIIEQRKLAEPHPANTIPYDDPREVGEFLHPERFGLPEWQAAKIALGSRGRSAQHQQRPMAPGDARFPRSWFPRYRREDLHDIRGIYLTVDASGGSTADGSSFSVIQAWGATPSRAYLLDEWRRRSGYNTFFAALVGMYEKWAAYTPGVGVVTVIEKAALGVAGLHQMQSQYPGAVGEVPRDDKGVRWSACEPLTQAGTFYVPASPDEMPLTPWQPGDFDAGELGSEDLGFDLEQWFDELEKAKPVKSSTNDRADAFALFVHYVYLRAGGRRGHTTGGVVKRKSLAHAAFKDGW